MPNVFPTLTEGGSITYGDAASQPLAQYPLTHSKGYKTRVAKFLDDSEQRWGVSDRRDAFVLEYKDISGYDAAVIAEFFHSMTGRYVDTALLNTFSIQINGVTRNYCVFDQDDLPMTESPESPNRVSFTLRFFQVRRN